MLPFEIAANRAGFLVLSRRCKVDEHVNNAIRLIEEENWVEVLRQCRTLRERYGKLMELLPETQFWSPMPARQLVFRLHQEHNLDFGVCPHYEMEGYRQYCTIDGEKIESTCVIPQPHCVNRDEDGEPRYPEFLLLNLEP